MAIRIVSLNIQHGGGKRIAHLGDWLAAKNPTVVVLPEWRDNAAGQQIAARLTDIGFRTVSAPRARSRANSVLLAARDIIGTQEITPRDSVKGDLILIKLEQRINVAGCYFPLGKAKAPFFQKCIEIAQKNSDMPFLVIGDFNTGRNDLDIEGTGARFHCADLFLALGKQAGLVDLWRARHGNLQEWTWYSRKNGFRIDHAFGNKAFIDRFPTFRCYLDHSPRLSGISDHSAVVLEAS
jgi:exonuclease III